MNKFLKKALILGTLSAIALLTFTACTQTDIIAKVSVTSFEKILKVSDVSTDEMYGGWSLHAPDKTTRFIFSSDFKTSAPHDIMMETDAKPFIDAGLDTSKLPAGMFVDGKIMNSITLFQHLENFKTCTNDTRGQRIREKIWTATLTK